MDNELLVVNVGCGKTPTPGAINIDNSFSIFLAKHKIIYRIISKTKYLSRERTEYIKFCEDNNIVRKNAWQIPAKDNSVDVIYTSQVLDILNNNERLKFFKEVKRVLKQDGILRIGLVDLNILVKNYLENHDADKFIESTYLANSCDAFLSKLSFILFGYRGASWRYDILSFTKMLDENGFHNIKVLKAGETTIKGQSNVNLFERESNSMYFECTK